MNILLGISFWFQYEYEFRVSVSVYWWNTGLQWSDYKVQTKLNKTKINTICKTSQSKFDESYGKTTITST